MAYDPFESRLLRGLTKFTLGLLGIPILAMLALFAWGKVHFYQQVREIPPKPFEVGLVYSGELGDPLGLMQFSISDVAAGRLRSNPRLFFSAIADGSEWKPTPAPVGMLRLGGDCGTFWCTQGAPNNVAVRWLKQPGSYFRRWGDSDAFIVVVNPTEKQVIVGYFYA